MNDSFHSGLMLFIALRLLSLRSDAILCSLLTSLGKAIAANGIYYQF